MLKKSVNLDTPFKRGEKVITTRPIQDFPIGTQAKVKLTNGLGNWRRYWVRFSDEVIIGQVDHDDLVRPKHLELWKQKEIDLAKAAEDSANAALVPAESPETTQGGSGILSQIPADLLERSKAAKKRLLG